MTQDALKEGTQRQPRLTQEERAAIARAHMKDHGGKFIPEEFVLEARSKQHPAHKWFTWDDTKAAHQWRLVQARQFVRVRIEIPASEEHDLSTGHVEIKYSPAFVSPIATRDQGGGYIAADTPEGKNELAKEAGVMLRQWYFRFGRVLTDPQDKTARTLLRKFPNLD